MYQDALCQSDNGFLESILARRILAKKFKVSGPFSKLSDLDVKYSTITIFILITFSCFLPLEQWECGLTHTFVKNLWSRWTSTGSPLFSTFRARLSLRQLWRDFSPDL